MTPTQRPTFSWRVIGGGGGFSYLPASGGATGSINFDFTGGSLPPGITFTRASIGTYFNAAGTLITAGNDVARMNYVSGVSCLLIERSATNTYIQSNNFSTSWNLGNSAVLTAAQFISPDGSNNGWSLSSGSAFGYCNQSITTASAPTVISIWAKNITGTAPVAFSVDGVDNSASPIAISASLARIFVSLNPTLGTNNAYFSLRTASGGSVNGFYGAQLEAGTVPTSYIPTTTVAVTRAADSAVFTVPTGVNQLKFTFDDNSTQTVAVSPGSYTIPTTLARPNIKSIQGRYAFDFTSGSLPAGMTFTRPSIGTYVNAGGTLITAGNDVARMNYVGGVSCLLIEGSATNLINQSNNFTPSTWALSGGATTTTAQFISPDGTNNGWALAGAANDYVAQFPTYSNAPYTISIWAKQITGSISLQLLMGTPTSGSIAISTTLARLSFTATLPAATDRAVVQIFLAAGTMGIYGAQLETGGVMTSYIPTTTAAVTRAADSATFTVPAGIGHLTYTFDDNSTLLVTVSAGSYTIPTTLNRSNIKSIVGSA